MFKSDNSLMYETYLNQSAIAHDQQRSTLKYRPKYDTNNSNLQQFAGLTGNGSMNPARVPSHEGEEENVIVKGYGKVTIPQLQDLIKKAAKSIHDACERDNFKIKEKVELLSLLLNSMSSN